MRTRFMVIALVLACGASARAGGGPGAPTGDADAAFARLKTLVGDWRSEANDERLSYELVAGGTALVERETGANRPAMVTLYHRDGDRLVLTHYCMAGNQPRMQAQSYSAATGELRFEFVDATNMATPAAGHMHSLAMRFVDGDHIETEWQFFQDGRATMTERARYTRAPQGGR